MSILKLKLCFTGPSVKRMEAATYKPNMLEGIGDQVLHYINVFCAIAKFLSPILVVYASRRGVFYPDTWRNMTHDQIRSLQNIVLIAMFTTTGAYLVRGIGRRFNSDYDMFLSKFLANDRTYLARSDFQFSHAPVEFAASPRSGPSWLSSTVSDFFQSPSQAVVNFFTYTFAHTIGIRMLYPGCTGIFNSLTAAPRDEKRREMQLDHGGLRLAVVTERGNRVETMFIDRRNRTENGNVLVVCSEGNAGFLEIGTAWTPLQLGYSVLCWGHSGFGGSDGLPFPENERAAIDAIMQYATQRAGFEPQKIILFGWSIGGHTVSYAAKLFPDVKCLIMDAVFDRLDELAVAKMPEWMSGIVLRTVRSQVDLNNVAHLEDYSGPVHFIRRTEDEMISTDEVNKLRSNRINELVIAVLRHRYPVICDQETEATMIDYVRHGVAHAEAHSQQFDLRMTQLSEVLEPLARRRAFPITAETLVDAGVKLDSDLKRSLALFLVRSHLIDFRSNHNAPLPNRLFTLPWSTSQ